VPTARFVVATAGLVALTGCGIGNPWPSVPSAVPGTVDVTLFGDSVIWTSGAALHAGLSFYGQANTVTDRAYLGMGLLDPTNHQYIADHLPASGVVVFEYVGVCGNCAYQYGSPEFYTAWEAAMREEIADARAKGLRVVWVKSPPVANPFFVTVAAQLSAMVDRVTTDLGVVEADWWQALGDTAGAYQQDLWYAQFLEGPWVHRVREDDGLHLTDEGRKRVASWTAAAVMPAAA
jgi:hypothetical protein